MKGVIFASSDTNSLDDRKFVSSLWSDSSGKVSASQCCYWSMGAVGLLTSRGWMTCTIQRCRLRPGSNPNVSDNLRENEGW